MYLRGRCVSDSHRLNAIQILILCWIIDPGLRIEMRWGWGRRGLHYSSSSMHIRVQPTLMCYKSFPKITLKTEWVHLLSLDSACKLLNLLQLLWSLQHVRHMLRGLTQIQCLSNIMTFKFQLFKQGCGFGSALFGKPDMNPHKSENLDPHQNFIQILEAFEAQTGALEDRGRLQCCLITKHRQPLEHKCFLEKSL